MPELEIYQLVIMLMFASVVIIKVMTAFLKSFISNWFDNEQIKEKILRRIKPFNFIQPFFFGLVLTKYCKLDDFLNIFILLYLFWTAGILLIYIWIFKPIMTKIESIINKWRA